MAAVQRTSPPRPSLTPNRPQAGSKSRSGAVSTEVCYPFGRKHGRHRAVKRREFITLIGGAAVAWPLAASAQQPKVWHVGFLAPVPPTPAMLSAFRDGLRERGYVEGQNLSIDVRWSEGSFEQNPGLAADLVRSNVDVIVAWSSPAVFAARRATSTIPIVMASVGDPVAGFVTNLARPGGNVTGLSNMSHDLSGKLVEL